MLMIALKNNEQSVLCAMRIMQSELWILRHQLQDKRRRGHRLQFEMVLDGYTVWPQTTEYE
jgi:hypothetical protein